MQRNGGAASRRMVCRTSTAVLARAAYSCVSPRSSSRSPPSRPRPPSPRSSCHSRSRSRRAGPAVVGPHRRASHFRAGVSRARTAVEAEGPVRTELLLTGRYPQGLTYEVRIAAFAGQPFLRIRHTITDMADVHYAPLRSFALAVPGHFTTAAAGIDGGVHAFE